MILTQSQRTSSRRAGLALIEVALSLVIFTVATSILAQTYRAGHGLRAQAHEEGLAMSAAQEVLETMRGLPLREVVARFDPDPFNDPSGPGTAHGAAFDVPGLDPVADDPDGRVGEIVLPLVDVGTPVAPRYELRENTGEARLGIPRDLDGDAIVDGKDHMDDAILLPVLVRLRWNGRSGPRQLEFFTALTEYSK